jgi:hypothetical protein
VKRTGLDTLLICDSDNDRVVEVTSSGVFLRAIWVKRCSFPFGIAYCGTRDVIAVSLMDAQAVILLHYESGAVKADLTIGSGTGVKGKGDGQLASPRGVSFTADSRYLLVADWMNHRVCKFSAVTGAFIAHVATCVENGILYPNDVLQMQDGSVVVAVEGAAVVCVGADGVTLQRTVISSAYSLAYSPSLKGVIVQTCLQGVFFMRDWIHSSRCAWLSAVTVG